MARNMIASAPVDVLNLALGKMGVPPVNAFDLTSGQVPETQEGRNAALFYNAALEAVQRAYYWEELITHTDITQTGEEYGAYQFPLPADCLRVYSVADPETDDTGGLPSTTYTQLVHDSQYHYEVRESAVWVEGPTAITLWYIARGTDPSLWSSELVECVVTRLASDAVMLVRGSRELAKDLRAEYETLTKPEAKRLQSKYNSSRNRYPHRYQSIRVRQHYR